MTAQNIPTTTQVSNYGNSSSSSRNCRSCSSTNSLTSCSTYFKVILYMMTNKQIGVGKEEIPEKTEKEVNIIINKKGENK